MFWALAALFILIALTVIVLYVPVSALLTAVVAALVAIFVALHVPLWVSASIAIAIPVMAWIGITNSLMAGGGIALAVWLWYRHFRQPRRVIEP